MNLFKAESGDLAWRQAADTLVHRRGTHMVDSRAGATVELLHAAIAIADPRARWVASRLPAMNIALAVAEVLQILAGGDDVSFLAHWFPNYPSFVGSRDRAHGAYGARLRVRWGFDQLARAANALTACGDTRQVVLSIWDPREDLPSDKGAPGSGDVPCNVLSCLRLVQGRLHWLQSSRSNDLFRGLPNNLVQFTCLQEVIAGWIGADVGSYSHTISSLHAYVSSLDEFSIDSDVPAMLRSGDIRLPRPDAETAWGGLYRMAQELVARPTGSSPNLPLPAAATALGPLQSMYWILVAEDARRRGWPAESLEAAARCSDGALSAMWLRWVRRLEQRNHRPEPMP
ncbi:MAG: thymidylate synthase [Phycisphaerales bacterium]